MILQDPEDILSQCSKRHADVRDEIIEWKRNVKRCRWNNPLDVREYRRSTDFLGGGCTVFNIKGNSYRLTCLIIYKHQLVLVLWMGTHAEYDKTKAKEECGRYEYVC
jgi:mRNA interferase HigB